jgi:hypothetical protein
MEMSASHTHVGVLGENQLKGFPRKFSSKT